MAYVSIEMNFLHQGIDRSKRLFRLEVVEDSVLDDKNNNKNLDALGISLYEITGATDAHTMQVTGRIHSLSLRILIDTVSTHCFLDTNMAACLELEIIQNGALSVMVANGKLPCLGVCYAISVKLGEHLFHVDFSILPLENLGLL